MEGPEILIPLFGIIGFFGWIPIAIHYKSKIRLRELELQLRGTETQQESKGWNTKQQGNSSNTNVAQAIEDLRKEVRDLRETSTRFDMAFDASLTTMEQRLEKAEARAYANPPHVVVPTTTEDTGQVLRNGRS